MSYQFEGEMIWVGNTQQVKDTFKKRAFVVKSTMETYPQEVQFELMQDATMLVDAFKVGDTVKVLFNLRGRAYNDKNGQPAWFTSVQAWKIEKLGSNKTLTSQQPVEDVPF